jgi:hypothetical protein
MRSRFSIATAAILPVLASISGVHSEDAPKQTKQTACTKLDFCYCVQPELLPAITANIKAVHDQIVAERAKGKAIGYLSVPLSPAGGGSFIINSEAAGKIAERVVARLGTGSVWILNPASSGGQQMAGATGADYMYMWTQILEGASAHGEDFDFVYFVGPNDFANYFLLPKDHPEAHLTDHFRKPDDYLGFLESVFDDRLANNAAFRKEVDQGVVTKSGFRNYYGLRASVAFSYGSHDEWNIARTLNERRRGADAFGIANQLAIFFDGKPANPGNYETGDAPGDAGRCIK